MSGNRFPNLRPFAPFALAAVAVAAPDPAEACSPPPVELTVAGSWPEDGSTDAPTDGVVLLRIRDEYRNGGDLAERAEITVRDPSGAARPGALVPTPFHGELLWVSGDGPLAPDTDYEVEVELHVEEWEAWDEPAGPTILRFTTGSEALPALEGPVDWGIELESWEKVETACAEDEGIDSCGGCFETVEVSRELRNRVRVQVPRPRQAAAPVAIAEVYVADSEEALAGAEPRFAARFHDLEAVGTRVDLGPAADVEAGDQVCARVDLVDADGAVIPGSPLCIGLSDVLTDDFPPPPRRDDDGDGDDDQTDSWETDDVERTVLPRPDGGDDRTTGGADEAGVAADDESERRAARNAGCDQSGGQPFGAGWAGLLLLGLMRRRRRR